MKYSTEPTGLEIAIIGLACRFPGAPNVEAFWQNLREGVESISFFSDEELKASGVDPILLNHPHYVKAGAVLDEIECFDAPFFGISPREAEIMDPQHRVFLECAWTALENAGYATEAPPGPIGMFAGASLNSYLLFNLYSNRELLESHGVLQILVGSDKDYVATHASYKLNLSGPSVAVQSACSTSLVAVHLACQTLISGECNLALAGGVSVKVPHRVGYLYQEDGIVSPDGHCRAFDARAQGTIFGNGTGVVVLKPLADAVADGDCIHAVIKGSALTNDGALKASLTAPGVEGQTRAIHAAHLAAEVKPETITYMEAHGTATALGDPIEVTALTQAFRAQTTKTGFCALGSVKTNIGHLDAAAGIAGLIKTVLALEHKQIPPSLHFEQPNPQIDFAKSPFYINRTLREWETEGIPRRAGVSSFGIGGTNAHVILEEAPPAEPSGPSRPLQLLTLSAKTETALDMAATQLAAYLKEHPGLSPADATYTRHVGRNAFAHRRAFVYRDLPDAIQMLEGHDASRQLAASIELGERACVFMFPGQGAQYVAMGCGIYETEAGFRQTIDSCCAALEPHLNLDLRHLLYPKPGQESAIQNRLEQTEITQPLLFVIEYALARLWMEWGVRPQAMIGHSIGEYVAACLAGVFSLEDALALVAARGRLMATLPAGVMYAVPLSEIQLAPLLTDGLSVAAVNTPSMCVVSGPLESMKALQAALAGQGIEARRLHTSHAFHSKMVEPVMEPFLKQVQQISLKPPKIPYVSNVTGTWITAAEVCAPEYWAKHLRQTVRFAQGIQTLLQSPSDIFVEVGPGNTLSTLVRQQMNRESPKTCVASLRHPQDQMSDENFLLTAVGRLWLAGVSFDWRSFYAHEHRRRIPLPTYPFERQRYWINPAGDHSLPKRGPLTKQPDLANWFYIPSWTRTELPARPAPKEPESILVFADTPGVAHSLIKRLANLGQEVITVTRGTEFSQLDETRYTLNPNQAADYATLIQELHHSEKLPHRVIHCWGIESCDSETDQFETSQHLGFYSLLYLAQAFGTHGLNDPLHLVAITSQVQGVTGDETLHPQKATILGPCQVIPQEYPQITCRMIDIVLPADDDSRQTVLADQLLAELYVSDPQPSVAYRGHHRWIPTFTPRPVVTPISQVIELRIGGVYLITGGLGGMGLVLADYLAQKAQAKIILINRSPFPSRNEWDTWLSSHDEQDSFSQKIRQLQEMENHGAQVWVLSADVANAAQMQSALAQIRERFGPIHGVIHAAGIAGAGLIQLKTAQSASSVMAPKIIGTQVLDTLLKEEPLDFFVLCSSLSALQGGIGQVDYSGANAFLDAFAYQKALHSSTRMISINWDAWQEVGMAVNTAAPAELRAWRQANLAHAITNPEGAQIFERILANPAPQLIISTLELQSRLERDRTLNISTSLETRQQARDSQSRYPRPNLATAYLAPQNETEQVIADLWQELLSIERIGIHDNYFELGGHSLLATQLVSRLREHFQVKMPLQSIFEAPTIAQLAVVIEDILMKEIETLSDEDVERLLESDPG